MAVLAQTRLAPQMDMTATDTDDRSLIRRIAERRDVAAFEVLYHQYRRRLGPFMYRIVNDPVSNEEVFNDVMHTVWLKSSTYNGQSKVSTWIFAIAYRQCLKSLRGRRNFVDIDDCDVGSFDETPGFEHRDLVGKGLAQLSPEHRLVIELSYFQGNNYQEIAAIAGCPENTVKTRMFHARRKLKTIMAELAEPTSAEETQ